VSAFGAQMRGRSGFDENAPSALAVVGAKRGIGALAKGA